MCLAVPGKILRATSPENRMAVVDFGGVQKEVCLDFVPDARVGEYVLVHVGVALQTIDEKEALEIFSYLKLVGETVGDGEGPGP